MSTDFILKPLMVLGTSSGAGKSLMTTALCRVLLRKGEFPLPFKGQNMSNNAWVDNFGGEMAYSQALQAWASNREPIVAMNPVLLKPKGDSTSEVIHLGKSVGIAKAESYYEDWVEPGWNAVLKALNQLNKHEKEARLIIEGAGSPVEVNLQKKDITNLRIANFLQANCVLVADIERGGVFAQIIGTLKLLKEEERNLIKGFIINRFRGDIKLFEEGKIWLEKETGIPVLGIMPWLNNSFPPEDSLDLIEIKTNKIGADLEIGVVKLPCMSNFSDLDPLQSDPSIKIKWIEPGQKIGKPDALIIPGSKQTISDLDKLVSSGLAEQIKKFVSEGGNILGICGGMQIMGRTLEDPFEIEKSNERDASKYFSGLDLIPIHTIFNKRKNLERRYLKSLWPNNELLIGFELHHGNSFLINESIKEDLSPLTEDQSMGWVLKQNNLSFIIGTYLHGILDNGRWRGLWLNILRRKKGVNDSMIDDIHFSNKREELINILANEFEKNIDISPLLK